MPKRLLPLLAGTLMVGCVLPATSGTISDYRALILDGHQLKWGAPALGAGAVVTYAIAGKSMDDLLVEIVELPEQVHPWFVAGQFHPEFTSTPRDGHPLFMGFVRAAREYKAVRIAPRLAKEAAA